MVSTEYIQHLRRGAFPGRIDPFAEDAHYFQQIHSGMIGALLNQIGDALLAAGYFGKKEVSLQVVAQREPDISIERFNAAATHPETLDYASAATAVLAEPGLEIDLYADEPELEAIKIFDSHRELVSVIEIISPRNKTHQPEILRYREERQRLFLGQNVNIIEIDITRSVKRLLEHPLTLNYPYHTVVYVPGKRVRVIVQEFTEPIKRCALPLRREVIPMDLQRAYDEAYYAALIAPQIEQSGEYHAQFLPFPTLLNEAQYDDIEKHLTAWKNDLSRLK